MQRWRGLWRARSERRPAGASVLGWRCRRREAHTKRGAPGNLNQLTKRQCNLPLPRHRRPHPRSHKRAQPSSSSAAARAAGVPCRSCSRPAASCGGHRSSCRAPSSWSGSRPQSSGAPPLRGGGRRGTSRRVGGSRPGRCQHGRQPGSSTLAQIDDAPMGGQQRAGERGWAPVALCSGPVARQQQQQCSPMPRYCCTSMMWLVVVSSALTPTVPSTACTGRGGQEERAGRCEQRRVPRKHLALACAQAGKQQQAGCRQPDWQERVLPPALLPARRHTTAPAALVFPQPPARPPAGWCPPPGCGTCSGPSPCG